MLWSLFASSVQRTRKLYVQTLDCDVGIEPQQLMRLSRAGNTATSFCANNFRKLLQLHSPG